MSILCYSHKIITVRSALWITKLIIVKYSSLYQIFTCLFIILNSITYLTKVMIHVGSFLSFLLSGMFFVYFLFVLWLFLIYNLKLDIILNFNFYFFILVYKFTLFILIYICVFDLCVC